MFIKKTQAEIDKMTPEHAEDYFAAKEAHELAQRDAAIKAAVEPIEAQLKTAVEKAEQLGLKLVELETKGSVSEENGIKKEFEANKEAIKAIVKGTPGEVAIKAVTNRASIANNPNEMLLPGIGELQHRPLTVLESVTQKTITAKQNDAGVIRYSDWNQETTIRAAAMRAEGVAFPESTAKFKTTSLPIEKVGDTLVVTEEFGEDADEFQNELVPFLQSNVMLVIDNQIMNGGGTSNELAGIRTVAPVYVPTGVGLAAGTVYDLIKFMKSDIKKNTKFMPDTVWMNENTYNAMTSEKDLNGQYIIPPFVSRDTYNVAGCNVVVTETVPDNQLVVGDSKKASLYNKGEFLISEGYKGDQFIEDTYTIKARKRICFLIKDSDKGAFRQSTNISGNILTLES